MNPYDALGGRETLIRHVVKVLEKQKYLPDDGRNFTYEAIADALNRMAEDVAESRAWRREGSGMRTEADHVVQVIAKALFDDGYLRGADTMRAADVPGPFSKMRSDAEAQRKRPTSATGREVANTFLRATVEDVSKPMADRIRAQLDDHPRRFREA